jgi:uncharacterized membrane protein YgdD (TMEM256/DUF423 family)
MFKATNGLAATGALLMALSIGMGAFAAHGLENILSTKYLAVFETGVRYQAYGSLGIIFLALAGNAYRKPALLLFWGIAVFSFSLYLLSMNELWGAGLKKLGAITPLGGLMMISAWIWAAYIFKKKNG